MITLLGSEPYAKMARFLFPFSRIIPVKGYFYAFAGPKATDFGFDSPSQSPVFRQNRFLHIMSQRTLYTFLCLLFIAQSSMAQMRGWEAGGWIGGANYFGDLNTNWRLNRIQLAGGAGARYNFNDRLALRIAANVGSLAAYDADSKNVVEQRRNLHFRSLVADAGLQFEFNFMPYVHGHRDYFYTPYMFAGPAAFYFNPKTELDGTWYELREFGTEGQLKGEEYGAFQAAWIYGFGFKTDLSYRWSVNIELSGRRIFTDYLDDVSGVYPDQRDLRNTRGEIASVLSDRSLEPKIGAAGRQRGNGKKNDAYAFLTIGALYYFGDIRCPSMTR